MRVLIFQGEKKLISTLVKLYREEVLLGSCIILLTGAQVTNFNITTSRTIELMKKLNTEGLTCNIKLSKTTMIIQLLAQEDSTKLKGVL
jgi:hypothetical protein